jgi:hypothetical protein
MRMFLVFFFLYLIINDKKAKIVFVQ